MNRKTTIGCASALWVVLTVSMAAPAMAQGKKLVWGLPGIPPVFGTTLAYVAQDQGFWKKYGVEVELRTFDSGAAAARAATAGDIDVALSPSPLIANQISNADANIVAIYGYPNPDWLIGSIEKGKASCADLANQPVGVDTVGGARSLALKEMLVGCGGNIDNVQQVALGTNVSAAMIAGRLTFGVLHLDDVPVIESQGKPVTTIVTMQKTDPNSHYLLTVAPIEKLKQNRGAYVALLAGLIDAGRYLQDPKNADHIAEVAAPTGRTKVEAAGALKRYLEMGFWAVADDGLDRKKLDTVVATQAKIGGIKEGKEPVKYERLVDQSVWRDAAAMTKK